MAKLNYFELITNASAGCLSDEDFAMVCQAYSMEKNIYAAKVIQKKWYHSSGVQVADSLEKFGGEVFSSNLWTLYFEYKAKNTYHKEVEDLLLERAVEEQFVFAKYFAILFILFSFNLPFLIKFSKCKVTIFSPT